MNIGILETGLPPEQLIEKHGSYPDMFSDLLGTSPDSSGFNYTTYQVVSEEYPNHPNDCDAWLITGSKHGAYDDLPWIEPLKAFIRQIRDEQVPLVGICFGHQIIAEALGGKVEKSNKGWGLGMQHYTILPESKWIKTQNQTLTLNAIHQDQIVQQPPGSEVIVESDFCSFAGLVYGDKILTMQGHPEFTQEFEGDLIKLRKGSVFPVDDSDQALQGLQDENVKPHAQEVAQGITDFFIK